MLRALACAISLLALPAFGQERIVRIGVMGDAMIGTVRPSAGQGPAILILHDLMETRNGAMLETGERVGVRLADALAQSGLASFRIDFRGSGDSRETPWAETTMSGQVLDARAALAWMAGEPEFAGRAIAVLGHGHGALIATSMLEDATPRPVALIQIGALVDPVQAYRDLLGADVVEQAQEMPQTVPVMLDLPDGPRELNALFFYELGWLDVDRTLRRRAVPILALSRADQGAASVDLHADLIADWLWSLPR